MLLEKISASLIPFEILCNGVNGLTWYLMINLGIWEQRNVMKKELRKERVRRLFSLHNFPWDKFVKLLCSGLSWIGFESVYIVYESLDLFKMKRHFTCQGCVLFEVSIIVWHSQFSTKKRFPCFMKYPQKSHPVA